MTPRTRASNKDANYKVYYSKKVPQQVRFPHKRKTVRRCSTPVQDGAGKRQMVFLPDKMRDRRRSLVEDSDVDDDHVDIEEDLEDGGVSINPQAGMIKEEPLEQRAGRGTNKKGRKRSSDVMEVGDSEDNEPVRPTPKRQRKAASPKPSRRSKQIEPDSKDKAEKVTKVDRERTLRRQSTMTQLVDGRKPLPGFDEPDFKPVKRSARVSWGNKGRSDKAESDRKQRTLTQMIPGMRPLEIMSDEDMEESLSDINAEERDSQVYGDAVAQRLLSHQPDGAFAAQEVEDNRLPVHSQDVPALVILSVEDATDQGVEDSYRPTQYIESPATRASRTSRRKGTMQDKGLQPAECVPETPSKPRKSRFSLLSTPEKRRIREIPSSQSPADSPLSTQTTPHKAHRSPLKECSKNFVGAPDTPSKSKQVTFNVPAKTPVPPPTLRKFQSTIMDSEDEGDEVIEEQMLPSGHDTGALTQAPIKDFGPATPGRLFGVETQAMIDQAYDAADEDFGSVSRESSQDSIMQSDVRARNQPSPELGEVQKQSSGHPKRTLLEEHTDVNARTCIEEQPMHENTENSSLAIDGPVLRQGKQTVASDAVTSSEAELSMAPVEIHSTPPLGEDCVQDIVTSTPINPDYFRDEEDEPGPASTPPLSSGRSLSKPTYTGVQQSTDLDGEPIQVPRSPSPQHETQQSHSSKAELQLQNEWFSFSQYVQARPPQSSSMKVGPDAFSYDATPLPPRPTAAPQQPSGYHPSQATTVDEITQRTPRKNRTQQPSSAHTTPHRVANSQPIISPSKPPPLFIPSSFPSPSKTAMDGWSSPIIGRTQAHYRSSQWASLEDFSIPAPPPVDSDD
jgi:hypothetical protein